MDERKNLRRATELWQEAYRYQMEGELDRAIDRYQRSIDVCPTAEAHTFLGWTLLPSALQSERRLPGRHAPPGNVHSADGWEKILLPIIERSQVRGQTVVVRADAAFALPALYEALERRGVAYAIRLPANHVLERIPAQSRVFLFHCYSRPNTWRICKGLTDG